MTENPRPSRRPKRPPISSAMTRREASFLRAYQSGRMPHAWLITGPRGIGKATPGLPHGALPAEPRTGERR